MQKRHAVLYSLLADTSQPILKGTHLLMRKPCLREVKSFAHVIYITNYWGKI
jgi:hypothetical protein